MSENTSETLGCGCVMEVKTILREKKSKYHSSSYPVKVRTLKTPCDIHKPNYAKKADKLMRRRNSAVKRKKFLDERYIRNKSNNK